MDANDPGKTKTEGRFNNIKISQLKSGQAKRMACKKHTKLLSPLNKAKTTSTFFTLNKNITQQGQGL